MKKNNLQDLQKEYGDVHKKILNSTSHYNIIIKQIIFYLNKTSSILDAGCGNGYLLKMINNTLQAKGYNKTILKGFDFSDKLVDNASKLNPKIEVLKQSLPKTEYKNQEFDLVTFCEVLEHLNCPLASMIEIRRILSDNGRLILTVPNGDRLSIIKTLNYRKAWQPADDIFFTYSELNLLFRKSGFRIEYVDLFGPRFDKRNLYGYTSKILHFFLEKFFNFSGIFSLNKKTLIFTLKKDDYLLSTDF